MEVEDSKQGRQVNRIGTIGEAISEGDNELEYEDVLQKIGFGKTQWVLLLISGLLTLTSMAAQQAMGIIVIASQCEFNTTQSEKGIMMAASVTGIFLSTYFWGYVSDAIGRRTVLLYGMLVTNLLQVILMFVTNIWLFNFINLMLGISLGGVTAAIYAYLSEFNTSKYRAVVINYSTMFVSIAAIYVPATAWLVLTASWSITVFDSFVFRPWRLIILLSMLPGFIGALMLWPFPESPKLLLAQNKQQEALDAVVWVCQFNKSPNVLNFLKSGHCKLKAEVLSDDDNVLIANRGCGILMNLWNATTPLFRKPHGTNFSMSVAAVFGMFFSSSGMQIWYPEIVNRSALDSAANGSAAVCEILDASFARQTLNSTFEDPMMCDDSISTKTYIDNMVVGFAFLLGFSIQGLLLNPLGRKNVILAALGISIFSGVLLHFVTNATTVLILFCLYILMPGLSISIMCGALVDLLPTNLRGKAVSIAFTLGRLGIILAANLIGIMLEPWCNATFAVFTGSMLACFVIVIYVPI